MFMVGLGVGVFVGLVVASWFALAVIAFLPRVRHT